MFLVMFDSTPFPSHGPHPFGPRNSILAIGDRQDIQLDGLGSRDGHLIRNQREALLAVVMPRDSIFPGSAVANT